VEFLFATKQDAETVANHLLDILKHYSVVYVGDLKDLIGEPKTYIDDTKGWMFLKDVEVREIDKGCLLILPEPGTIESTKGVLMAVTTNEALDNYKALSEWAAKAREELGSHCFIFVDEGDAGYDEINNDEVLALCHEYDELIKKEK